jgi:hypothetical protein
MSLIQIVRIVAVAVAVIGAFVAIPEAGLIMAIIGLVIGAIGVDADRATAFLVSAIALSAVAGSLGSIPVAGEYATSILGNASAIFNAGAVAVIVMGIKDRVMES